MLFFALFLKYHHHLYVQRCIRHFRFPDSLQVLHLQKLFHIFLVFLILSLLFGKRQFIFVFPIFGRWNAINSSFKYIYIMLFHSYNVMIYSIKKYSLTNLQCRLLVYFYQKQSCNIRQQVIALHHIFVTA